MRAETYNRCYLCAEEKPLAEMVAQGKSPECLACKRQRSREWGAANAERKRDIVLRQRYGISSAEYDTMFAAQGGVCAICGRPPSGGPRSKYLFVDHDHDTGAVRGLLCPSCNTSLEWLIVYGKRGEQYLRDHASDWEANQYVLGYTEKG